MLLHDSRRDARLEASGDRGLLGQQDRRLWNHAQIAEALPLAAESLRATPGPDESERRFLNRRLRDLQRRES